MSRIAALNPAQTSGKAKELLDAVQAKLGLMPNLMRTLAHSPAALQAYLDFSDALAAGVLSPRVREQIALTVAEANSCGYCLSAHTALGKMGGLSDKDITAARQSYSDHPKTAVALRLARTITLRCGEITDKDFQDARDGGLKEAEITEVVANVALNIFTNYFNHIAQTEIDFPKVEPDVCATEKSTAKSCGCSG